MLGLLSISFVIGACGTVEIKDQEVCIDLVEDGGTCNHTLQELPAVYAPGSEWDLKRYGRISLSPEGFGELKIEIEQLCEVSKKCTWEFKKKMANLWKWYEQNKPKKQPEAEEEPDNGVIPDSVWEHTQGSSGDTDRFPFND